MDLQLIWDGWRNNLNWSDVDPELKRIFEERLNRCGECPHAVQKEVVRKIQSIVDGKKKSEIQKSYNGFKCDVCGCVLTWAVSSLGKYCPLREEKEQQAKWNEIVLDENEKVIDDGLTLK